MAESAKIKTKAPEAKRENPISQTHKPERSQSMDSPIDRILFLQQTIGNRAVQRMMKSGAIQAKLTIGQPGDKYEQEADRVADQVMRMPEPQEQPQLEEEKEKELQTKPLAEQITPLVQRQAEPEEEEEKEKLAQAKLTDGTQVQRQGEEPEEEEKKEEEEGPIQPKRASGQTSQVSRGLETQIHSLKGGGQPLPKSERAFFEPRFGVDFSSVRIHTNPQAGETAKKINARAFTMSRNIVFGHKQYAPNTTAGKKLLAHELTHVVQQNQVLKGDCLEDLVEIQRQTIEAEASGEVSEQGVTELGRNHYALWGFTSRGIELTQNHRTQLDTIIDRFERILILQPATEIWIVGHSDESGNPQLDDRLSLRRAASVFSYLKSRGVPSENIDLDFHGSSNPWFPNATRRGRSRNRRVDVQIVEVTRPPEARRRLHGWNIDYGPSFRTHEGGVSLDSMLLANVTALSIYLLSQGIVRGNILFRDGARSRQRAHIWSTAHNIQTARGQRRSALLRNLQALPKGKDCDGNLWYKPRWSWDDIVTNSRGHRVQNAPAAEGYPRRNKQRRPNTDGPGISQHIKGQAMDVSIPWPYDDPWDRRADRFIRQFGLHRPIRPREPWHYELQ